MSRRARRLMVWVLALMLVASTLASAAPEGQLTMGRSLHAGADALRARRDAGPRHAVHGPLRAPRRAREADAGQDHGAEPGRVVERVAGRARLRVRAAQGGEVPQRRARHRRGREVLVRALPRHLRADAQGAGRRDRDAGSRPRPLPPQAALAGLHDLLRHAGDGRGLDRPQEVRREGGRGRLQEGADRRRALRFVSFTPGVELVLEAIEQLLAQDAEREAPGVQGDARTRSTRLAVLKRGEVDIAYAHQRRARRGGAAHAGAHAAAHAVRVDPLAASSPTSGIRARRGTTSACAWRPTTRSTVRRSTRRGPSGFSQITGSIIPASFDFYWQPPVYPYDPAQGQAAPRGGRLSRTASMPATSGAMPSTTPVRRGGPQRPAGGRDQDEAASARARGVHQGVSGEEAQEHHLRPERHLRQRGHPARSRSWSRAAPTPTADIPTSTGCSGSRRASSIRRSARRSCTASSS